MKIEELLKDLDPVTIIEFKNYMMKFKRLAAALLSAAMVVSLVACSGKSYLFNQM